MELSKTSEAYIFERLGDPNNLADRGCLPVLPLKGPWALSGTYGQDWEGLGSVGQRKA